ncbi:MAG: efflux RND transporter periplasmic adaptor subunit [Alphaproteobacteria bacterium]
MKSSKLIAMGIALAGLLWVGSGLFFDAMEAPDIQSEAITPRTEEPLLKVRVRTMEAAPYTDEILVTGRTQASRTVRLKAEIGGVVEQLEKEEGGAAAEGEVLAVLEVRDRAARVAEARERADQRRIEYDAARKLEDKGFNSKVRRAQALADLESARAALKQAEIELEKTKIKAPFDGIVSDQVVEAGDYLAEGDPLFTLVDLDPVELTGFVSERQIQEIVQDSSVRAEFLDGSLLEGRITYIAPAADEQTRTFRIVISAPNPDLRVKDGLTAKLRIPSRQKQAYKISPSILSLDDQGRIGVKTVDQQSKVRFLPVMILSSTPESMWVGGLPDTVRIITVGQDFVIPGQAVEPVESEGGGLL